MNNQLAQMLVVCKVPIKRRSLRSTVITLCCRRTQVSTCWQAATSREQPAVQRVRRHRGHNAAVHAMEIASVPVDYVCNTLGRL